MAFTTLNTAEVIRQELYSTELQRRLQDWLVGMPLFNDRTSEFPDGDELKIPQIGQRIVRDYVENSPVDFSAIDLDRIALNVTEYKQDGFYITDKDKADSYLYESLWNSNVAESALAVERDLETAVFEVSNQQTLSDLNLINGGAHRYVASGTSQVLTLKDISRMKLSFDLARVQPNARVLFIDPTTEFTLNDLVGIVAPTTGDIFNKDFTGIVNDGFGNRLNFVTNIYGFNIMIAHTLPKIASETIDSVSVTNGVANIAMSMASAEEMPFMGVMRQQPTPEFFRNTTLKRDEWSTTYRYGFALQRPETLGVILTSTQVV